jgi:hypothetical protein
MAFVLGTENNSMLIHLKSPVVLFAACIPKVLVRISISILNILMGL